MTLHIFHATAYSRNPPDSPRQSRPQTPGTHTTACNTYCVRTTSRYAGRGNGRIILHTCSHILLPGSQIDFPTHATSHSKATQARQSQRRSAPADDAEAAGTARERQQQHRHEHQPKPKPRSPPAPQPPHGHRFQVLHYRRPERLARRRWVVGLPCRRLVLGCGEWGGSAEGACQGDSSHPGSAKFGGIVRERSVRDRRDRSIALSGRPGMRTIFVTSRD